MAKQTFSILLRLDDDGKTEKDDAEGSLIADCLGHLFGVEGIVEFKHWIASLLVVGWKLIAKTGSKEQKEKHSCGCQTLSGRKGSSTRSQTTAVRSLRRQI